ncbi:hypothetical protein SLE2022_257130 [Rubroshorea leprosula]
MASSFLLFLFSIAIVSLSSSNNAAALTDPKPKALILSVVKDIRTLQYYTIFNFGSDYNFFNAAIDLGRPFLWINCVYKSSTYRPVPCGSAKMPGRWWSWMLELQWDSTAQMTQISASTQLSSAFNIPRKFAIGLPSTESTDGYLGDIFIGGDPYNYKMRNDTCKYMSKTLTKTPPVTNPVSTAPIYSEDEPKTDLVLQRSSVHWRIYRHNSMVKVKKDVMCLAFVDGGLNPRTAIVIGGHQLEDNLLQFDLAASKIGFSSPLLLRNANCFQFRTVIF